MRKNISKKTSGLILIIVIILLAAGIILSNIYLSNGLVLINTTQLQNHTIQQYNITVVLPAASYINYCPTDGGVACIINQTSGIYNISLELPYNGFLVFSASKLPSGSNAFISIINNVNSNVVQSFYNGTSLDYHTVNYSDKGQYYQELASNIAGALIPYTNLTQGKSLIPVFSGNLILKLVNTNAQLQTPISINLEYFGYKNQQVHKKTYYTVTVPPNGITSVYNITIQTPHSGYLALNISSSIVSEPNYIYNSSDYRYKLSNYTNISYLPSFELTIHNDTGAIPSIQPCYNDNHGEAECFSRFTLASGVNRSSLNTTSHELYLFPVVAGIVNLSIFPYSNYYTGEPPNSTQRYNISWQYVENMP